MYVQPDIYFDEWVCAVSENCTDTQGRRGGGGEGGLGGGGACTAPDAQFKQDDVLDEIRNVYGGCK